MPYIDPALINDEGAVSEAVLAGLADIIPGLSTEEGHVEAPLAEAVGIVVATAVTRIIQEAKEAFAYGFGRRILGLTQTPAGLATTTATFTLDITTGPYTIDAGFGMTLPTLDGETADFVTLVDAVITEGDNVIHDVPIASLDPGTQANGAVGTPLVFDDFAHIVSITVLVPAAGGTEEQSFDDFADTVADQAQRVRALPITPEDFAAFALRVPGVGRALAFNRLDPAAPGVDSPGHITIYAADSAGQPASGPVLAALQAALDGAPNLLGTTRHAVASTLTSFDVNMTVRRSATSSGDAETADAAEAALRAGLATADYAYDRNAPGRWTPGPAVLTAFDLSALVDDLTVVRGVVSADFDTASTKAITATSLPVLGDVNITVVS